MKISEIIQEVIEDMCSNYCKLPDEYGQDEDGLIERCDNCPLDKLR